jgi:hypothetical protein
MSDSSHEQDARRRPLIEVDLPGCWQLPAALRMADVSFSVTHAALADWGPWRTPSHLSAGGDARCRCGAAGQCAASRLRPGRGVGGDRPVCGTPLSAVACDRHLLLPEPQRRSGDDLAVARGGIAPARQHRRWPDGPQRLQDTRVVAPHLRPEPLAVAGRGVVWRELGRAGSRLTEREGRGQGRAFRAFQANALRATFGCVMPTSP